MLFLSYNKDIMLGHTLINNHTNIIKRFNRSNSFSTKSNIYIYIYIGRA